MSRKLPLGARRKGRPIEPKNLYDGNGHAVSHRGDNASAADHLWMAGGDRRLKHSVLGELAGPAGCRCPRIFRLHAEQVAEHYTNLLDCLQGVSDVLSLSARCPVERSALRRRVR